jgi:phosphopantothenoylcysteine synthetase/decarboxylase
MADPVTMTAMQIGSQVVGNIAGAKGKAAQEAAQNAATLSNYFQQQNKEAMASDRQNEKLMDQLYNTQRANEMLEYESMQELFGNAAELQRQGQVARNDLATKSREVQEANKINAMSRGVDGSALDNRISKLNIDQFVKSSSDLNREQTMQQSNLLQRRSGQLASRQSEAIIGNTFQFGRAPTLYDNSSTFMTGALISSVGSIAGGVMGYNKYKGG